MGVHLELNKAVIHYSCSDTQMHAKLTSVTLLIWKILNVKILSVVYYTVFCFGALVIAVIWLLYPDTLSMYICLFINFSSHTELASDCIDERFLKDIDAIFLVCFFVTFYYW